MKDPHISHALGTPAGPPLFVVVTRNRVDPKVDPKMEPDLPVPQFVHRYLADGSVEYICMDCLATVCNVSSEADAASFLDAHTCEGASTSCADFATLALKGRPQTSPRGVTDALAKGLCRPLVSPCDRTPRPHQALLL